MSSHREEIFFNLDQNRSFSPRFLFRSQSKKESDTEGAAGRSTVPHTQPETIRGNEEESIIQSVKKEEEDEEEDEEEEGFSAISSSSNEASGGVQKEYDWTKRSPVEPVRNSLYTVQVLLFSEGLWFPIIKKQTIKLLAFSLTRTIQP